MLSSVFCACALDYIDHITLLLVAFDNVHGASESDCNSIAF